jgi:hypothetical protein
MKIHCMSQQKPMIWEKNNLLAVLHKGVVERMSSLSTVTFNLKTTEMSNITFVFLWHTGGRTNSKPENAGIIAPAYFMMLRNEDLFEDDLSRVEKSAVVTQKSYSNRQPLLHSHTTSLYRFTSLSGRVSGTSLSEEKENEVWGPRTSLINARNSSRLNNLHSESMRLLRFTNSIDKRKCYDDRNVCLFLCACQYELVVYRKRYK